MMDKSKMAPSLSQVVSFCKSSIKKIVCKLLTRSFDTLEQEISTANIVRCVSFDIFDTLIVRDVTCPADVFNLLERSYNKHYGESIALAKIRADAELRARRVGGRSEPTLAIIYEKIEGVPKERIPWLMNRELELELLLCNASVPMHRIWQQCINSELKVIIVSDTYFPKSFIENLLETNGYTGWDSLYVSSEYGDRKATGELFRFVGNDLLERYNIVSNEVCHIGDSIKSDWLNARRCGMRSILINNNARTAYFNKKMKHWSSSQAVFEYGIVNSFVRNHLSSNADYFEILGYEALGPILLGFSKWLEQVAKADGIEKIFFLTREGLLLKRAYEIYRSDYNESDCVLLEVSRRATSIPLLVDCSSLDEIMQITRIPRGGARVGDALAAWGIKTESIRLIVKACNLNISDNIVELKEDVKQRLFEALQPELVSVARSQRQSINTYLDKMGFNGKIAVVDIGWFGTIQSNLQALRPNTSINGYYVAKKHNYGGISRPLEQKFYLYDDMYSVIGEKLTSAVEVFELFFLSADGSVLGYKFLDDEIAIPLREDSDSADSAALDIAMLQNSALKFIDDFKELVANLDLEMSSAACSAAYCAFIDPPSRQMIQEFKKFTLTDTGVKAHELFATGTFMHYLCHPGDFVVDFKGPGSKGIFLKNVFKLPLPWPRILALLRKAEGQDG